MTLTTPFSGNLTVYASANAGTGDPTGAEVILTTGSGAVSVPCAVLATGNPAADHGISAGAVSNVTAITLKQASRGTKLYWLELDGRLLTDANLQDTVTDTPLQSYAVHTGVGASNGNLVQTNIANVDAQPTSFTLSADSKIYFESSMQSGSAFHVGVTNGSGTVSVLTDDGITSGATLIDGSSVTWGVGDVVGVAIDVAAKTMIINGTSTYSLANCDAGYSPLGLANPGVQANNFGQQPFVNTPPDGYEGFYQTWDEWATMGLFFFNENTGRTITSFELNRKYGLTAASPDAGIYNLTFQPRARVFDYLKQATSYLPLEDLLPQLEATEASLASTQADLDAAQAALVTATEDIAENLAAFAALVARVETLENP